MQVASVGVNAEDLRLQTPRKVKMQLESAGTSRLKVRRAL